jgi:uncharacterized repeat protein (TIGR01451 family)
MKAVLSTRSRSRRITMLLMVGVAAFGAANLLVSRADAQGSLPDLTISKNTLEDPPYVAGQTVHYTLAVQNQDADMAGGSTVLVRDLLGPGVVLHSATEGARAKEPFYLGVSCTQTTPELFCEGPALVHDDYFIVLVEVELPASGRGTILNHAWVDPADSVQESNEGNNAATFKIKMQ